jgi:hypothetical protein
MNLAPMRPHYLLKIDAAKVIFTDGRNDHCLTLRVYRELRETSLVVVLETPVCGFSLAEYAKPFAGSILFRTSAGPILGDNPWNRDLRSISLPIEDRFR